MYSFLYYLSQLREPATSKDFTFYAFSSLNSKIRATTVIPNKSTSEM